MMKWEYKLTIGLSDSDDVTALDVFGNNYNSLGQQGWELVAVDSGIAYFKRALESGGIDEKEFNDKVIKSIQQRLK